MELKHFRISLMLLIATLAFGTSGYVFVEDMTFFEAFYMTMITISTVGFGEVRPLSPLGRVITIILITTGITLLTYTISTLLRMLIEGELRKTFGRRKLEKEIAKLKNHYIVCGYGRIGQVICRELAADAIPFVVIDDAPAKIELLEHHEYLFLAMDATSEETLIKAGIMHARGLVTAVDTDANNIFITLTARGLRSDIFILSRTSDVKHENKLKKAGANRVVCPYLLGGRRMAQVMRRPTVVDFIDSTMMTSNLGLVMEEALIGPDSRLIGKNLMESNLRKDYGVIIVAIKHASGEMVFNPVPREKLSDGDTLVLLGKRDEMKRMNDIL